MEDIEYPVEVKKLSYTFERENDFKSIVRALKGTKHEAGKEHIVINGDSLRVLENIPSNSISLILTDPPYHSTKKKNITGDTSFQNNDDYIQWMEAYSIEWKRILKSNGSIYMFCSSQMAAHLEVMFSTRYNILSNIIWTKPNEPGFDGWKQKMKKDSLRQWYPHTERIIYATPAVEGNLHRSYFADFLRETRKICGISGHQLTEETGAYGKVNHGGAVSNWETGRNIPSREQYEKICSSLLSTKKIKEMPFYEDLIRAFDVNKDIEFTDVWNFFSVRPYKGKHPAEKPLDMLEHMIKSSSYEHDIVLDCFSGSGSTLIAALKNNRKVIGIEIEEKYFKDTVTRVSSKQINEDSFCMKKSIQFDYKQQSLSIF